MSGSSSPSNALIRGLSQMLGRPTCCLLLSQPTGKEEPLVAGAGLQLRPVPMHDLIPDAVLRLPLSANEALA